MVCLGGLACGGLLQSESTEFDGPHLGIVQGVDIDPAGTRLATASQDRSVRIWSLPDQVGERVLHHDDLVVAVAFSSDGSRLATGGADGVRVWDTGSWTVVGEIPREVFDLDWSGDRIALALARDPVVELWDSATSTEVARLEGHLDWVHAVRFSEDGTTLASGSKDQTIRLWDVSSGAQTGLLVGHSGPVLALDFAADGRRIASGASDKAVRVWDLDTGEPVRQMTGHRDFVTGVELVDGVNAVVSVARDGVVNLWDVGSGEGITRIDIELGSLEDVRVMAGRSVIAVGKDVFVRDLGVPLDEHDFAREPRRRRKLSGDCLRLRDCGLALAGLAEHTRGGIELVQMARELQASTPETCLQTLEGVPSTLAGAPPPACITAP